MKRFTLIGIFALLTVGIVMLSRFAMPQPPAEILATALTSVRDASSVSGVVSAAMLLPGVGEGSGATPFIMRAAFKFSMPSATVGGAGHVVVTALGAGNDGSDAFGELRVLPDGTSYARVDHLPLGPKVDKPEDVYGKWWQMDRETLGTLLVSGKISAVSAVKEGSTTLDQSAISARWERMRSSVTSGEIFATDGTEVTEFFDGARTHRVTLGFRRSEAVAFLTDLHEALLGRALTAAELADVTRVAEDGSARLTVWVDAKTGTLMQAQLDLGAGGDGAARRFTITAIDFATPVTVEAPPEPKPFDNLAKILLGQ